MHEHRRGGTNNKIFDSWPNRSWVLYDIYNLVTRRHCVGITADTISSIWDRIGQNAERIEALGTQGPENKKWKKWKQFTRPGTFLFDVLYAPHDSWRQRIAAKYNSLFDALADEHYLVEHYRSTGVLYDGTHASDVRLFADAYNARQIRMTWAKMLLEIDRVRAREKAGVCPVDVPESDAKLVKGSWVDGTLEVKTTIKRNGPSTVQKVLSSADIYRILEEEEKLEK